MASHGSSSGEPGTTGSQGPVGTSGGTQGIQHGSGALSGNAPGLEGLGPTDPLFHGVAPTGFEPVGFVGPAKAMAPPQTLVLSLSILLIFSWTI